MVSVSIPPLAELIAPQRTALVVIDVQNDFCDPLDYPASAEMLPRLKQLLATAREAGVQVIYSQSINSERTDSSVWLSRYAKRPHRHIFCLEGTPGADFQADVKPEPGDIVVVKHRYSIFIGTEFDVILRSKRIESLVFAGVATNGCVESSVRDAYQRDYWTVTLSDCTAAASPALQEGALRSIDWNFGLVATSDEIAQQWKVATPRPVPGVAVPRNR